MAVVSISNLSHKYGLDEVLTDINLSVRQGETLAIVGPSGCGKSTLLQCIGGLLEPSEGCVQLQHKTLAYVFQDPRLLPWKTSLDNLSLGLKALKVSKKERHLKAMKMGELLGLDEEDLSKYPHELSGGMQSRVALGRALLLQPDLLLLDEPFSALDIGLKLELYQLLRQQVQQLNTSVIMITHDLMEAVRLADRIIMMAPEPGRILEEFPLNHAHDLRNDQWIYLTSAQLMQEPSVRLGFDLPTLIQEQQYEA